MNVRMFKRHFLLSGQTGQQQQMMTFTQHLMSVLFICTNRSSPTFVSCYSSKRDFYRLITGFNSQEKGDEKILLFDSRDNLHWSKRPKDLVTYICTMGVKGASPFKSLFPLPQLFYLFSTFRTQFLDTFPLPKSLAHAQLWSWDNLQL